MLNAPGASPSAAERIAERLAIMRPEVASDLCDYVLILLRKPHNRIARHDRRAS